MPTPTLTDTLAIAWSPMVGEDLHGVEGLHRLEGLQRVKARVEAGTIARTKTRVEARAKA